MSPFISLCDLFKSGNEVLHVSLSAVLGSSKLLYRGLYHGSAGQSFQYFGKPVPFPVHTSPSPGCHEDLVSTIRYHGTLIAGL